jgi:hypothetical protein
MLVGVHPVGSTIVNGLGSSNFRLVSRNAMQSAGCVIPAEPERLAGTASFFMDFPPAVV